MFSLHVCQVLLGALGLLDNYVSYSDQANILTLKHKGQGLIVASLPQPKPYKIKLGKECEKIHFMNEIWEERIISIRPLTLLLVESNISDEVKPLHSLVQ